MEEEKNLTKEEQESFEKPIKEPTKQPWIIVVILIIAVVVLIVLARTWAFNTSKNMTEDMIEAGTGAKVEMLDENGMKITVKDEDGNDQTVSFQADEDGLEIPDELKEVPLFEPAKMISSSQINELGMGGTFSTDKSVNDVKDFYLDKMEDEGWTQEALFDVGGQVTMSFKKGEAVIMVSVFKADDKTQFIVNYSEEWN